MKALNSIIFVISFINGSTAVMSMDDDIFENSHGPSYNEQHINAAHRTVSNIKKTRKQQLIILKEQEKFSQNIESSGAIKEILEQRKLILDEKRNKEE